jgi:hypothetical protein
VGLLTSELAAVALEGGWVGALMVVAEAPAVYDYTVLARAMAAGASADTTISAPRQTM